MSEKHAIKFVMVGESLAPETQIPSMIECLGVFDTSAAAYGRAVMYLSELTDGVEGESTITPLVELEGQTGFGLYLKNTEKQAIHNALVLFYYSIGNCKSRM